MKEITLKTLADMDGRRKEVQLCFDGSCLNPGKQNASMRIGYHIISSRPIAGKKEYVHGESIGKGTVAMAEYHSLLAGLKYLLDNGYTGHVEIFGDDQSLVKQVKSECKCNKASLKELLIATIDMLGKFKSYNITWISRKKNKTADKASRMEEATCEKHRTGEKKAAVTPKAAVTTAAPSTALTKAEKNLLKRYRLLTPNKQRAIEILIKEM